MKFLILILTFLSVATALPTTPSKPTLDSLENFEYILTQMANINLELKRFNGNPSLGARLIRHTQEVLQTMDESITEVGKSESIGFFKTLSWVGDGLKRLQQCKEFAKQVLEKQPLLQKANLGAPLFQMLDQYYRVNKKMVDVFAKKFPSFLESTIKWWNGDVVDQLEEARDAFKVDASNPGVTVVYEPEKPVL